MSQNQPEQEAGIFQKASEYRQKTSNTMYVISLLLGLLIIIAGYIILKAIADFIGLWASILIMAMVSIFVARKL